MEARKIMFQVNGKTKSLTLYNVLLPICFLLLFPILWIVVLPANFLWDSILLFLGCKFLKVPLSKGLYKKIVFPVWCFGFLSDFIATIPLFGMLFVGGKSDWLDDWIVTPMMANPFESGFALVYVALAVLLGGVCIYFFNLKVSLKKLDIPPSDKQRLCLILAVFSAPYLFFLPTTLLYRWVG